MSLISAQNCKHWKKLHLNFTSDKSTVRTIQKFFKDFSMFADVPVVNVSYMIKSRRKSPSMAFNGKYTIDAIVATQKKTWRNKRERK